MTYDEDSLTKTFNFEEDSIELLGFKGQFSEDSIMSLGMIAIDRQCDPLNPNNIVNEVVA